MRFFVSPSPQKNPSLRVLLLILLIFLSLFWLLNWFYQASISGLTPGSLKLYFYGPPDFPERISLSALLEDLHITFFMNFFLLFFLASLHAALLPGLPFLASLSFFFLIGDGLFSLLALKEDLFLYLKLACFVGFQLSVLLLLLRCWRAFLGRDGGSPGRDSLRKLVALFSLFGLLFLGLTLFLFYSKFSFSTGAIEVYYRGSEERFIPPKSLEGLLRVLHYHLLGISLFSFGLAHFLLFGGVKFAGLLGSLSLLLPLLEILSGFGVLLWGKFFALLKLLLFLSSFLLLVSLCASVLVVSLRRDD